MKSFDFTLAFDGVPLDDVRLEAVSCSPRMQAGQLWLSFHREAADINAAINEATAECRAAGLPAPAFVSLDQRRGRL